MSRIIVDTWAWIAMENTKDSSHIRAMQVHNSLIGHRYRYVTTNFILTETYNLMRKQTHGAIVVAFGRRIHQLIKRGGIELLLIDSDIERDAWRLFELYDDVNGLSYTDCTSFAAMKRHDLRQAFTNDKHFAMAGFELMPQ